MAHPGNATKQRSPAHQPQHGLPPPDTLQSTGRKRALTTSHIPSSVSSKLASRVPKGTRNDTSDPPTGGHDGEVIPTAVSQYRRRLSTSSSSRPSPQLSVPSPGTNGYFSPQPSASGPEAKSPATRKPPASHSSNGIETSQGPPVALITRGAYSAELARRAQLQRTSDFAFAQQQLLHSGLVSPGRGRTETGSATPRGQPDPAGDRRVPFPEKALPVSNEAIVSDVKMESDEPLPSSGMEDSSDNDMQPRHRNRFSAPVTGRRQGDSGTEEELSGQGSEDLFLYMAQDASQHRGGEGGSLVDRRRVREDV
jgi:hypothetical protein